MLTSQLLSEKQYQWVQFVQEYSQYKANTSAIESNNIFITYIKVVFAVHSSGKAIFLRTLLHPKLLKHDVCVINFDTA